MERSAQLGTWWFPDTPDDRFCGVLREMENGHYRLEYETDPMVPKDRYWPLIHGETRGHYYSLIDNVLLTYGFQLSSSGTHSQTLSIGNLLQGILVDDREERFPAISFQIEGLQEWTQLTGFQKEIIWRESSVDNEYAFHRSAPEDIVFTARDMVITLRSAYHYPSGRWGVTFTEDSLVRIESDRSRSIYEWRDQAIYPLQRLVQLVTRQGGTISNVSVRLDTDASGSLISLPHRWFQLHSRWMKQYPTPSDRRDSIFHALFFAGDLHRVTDGSLDAWFDEYGARKTAIDAMLDLPLTAQSPPDQFFGAARYLERLMERFPSAELFSKHVLNCMKDRIRDLLDESNRAEVFTSLGNARGGTLRRKTLDLLTEWQGYLEPLKTAPEMIPWLARLFVFTRNCIAHHSEETCREAALDNSRLIPLLEFTRTLVDAEVLRLLGFAPDHIFQHHRDTTQYRRGRDLELIYRESVTHGS